MKVAVIGAGPLGQAVAGVLVKAGVDVAVWTRDPSNKGELPGKLAGSVGSAAEGAALVMFAVPAGGLADVAHAYGEVATPDQLILHAVRGVCRLSSGAMALPHEVIRSACCARKIGVMGGPLYAPALSGGRPVAGVLASRFDEVFEVGADADGGKRSRPWYSAT